MYMYIHIERDRLNLSFKSLVLSPETTFTNVKHSGTLGRLPWQNCQHKIVIIQ